MKNHNRKYDEHSSSECYRDSIVYAYEELGNPGVMHFYKKYKSHVSKKMLEMYHHIHHYLNEQTLDIVKAKGIYDEKPYTGIQFHILDLDPNDIRIVCDIKTRQQHYITQPQYIEDDTLACFNIHTKDYNLMSVDLTRLLHQKGLHVEHISKDNIKPVGIKEGILQVTITDLANRLPDFCEYNLDRFNIHILGCTTKRQVKSNDLYMILAHDEQFANPDQNTTTQ